MKIYASDNQDKSLEIFKSIAGSDAWIKVKCSKHNLITYIKVYSVVWVSMECSTLPYWAHEYVDNEEFLMYECDYDIFKRCMTTTRTKPVSDYYVVNPIEMYTDDELTEFLANCRIVPDDEDI